MFGSFKNWLEGRSKSIEAERLWREAVERAMVSYKGHLSEQEIREMIARHPRVATGVCATAVAVAAGWLSC